MKRARATLIALTLALVCTFAAASPAFAASSGMIRVKLTRLGAPQAIAMQADCDYYLASDPAVRVPAGTAMRVAAADSGMRLSYADKTVELGAGAKLMRAESGNRGLCFSEPSLSNRFCGDLGLAASGGVITAVLNIYVENYLYGVVGYAMSPSCGIEALKAQAVATRTYALRKKSTRSDSAYDVTDTVADYVFKGYSGQSDYANVVAAVDETRGVVLYYGSALAQCYHCVSNGGQTESARNAWGTTLDYTAVRDDPYDLASSAVVKTAQVNRNLTGLHAELKEALTEGIRYELESLDLSTAPGDVRVNQIESITACDSRFPAPSRLYKSLTFKISVSSVNDAGSPRTNSLSISIPTYGGFEKWYDLSINAEDTETVWVNEIDGAFEISFRRQGSGVGLSQRGAQVMAGSYGKSMAEILDFYYPGTEAKQVSLSDATHDQGASDASGKQKAIAMARLSDVTNLLSTPDDAGAVTATVPAGAVVEVYAVKDEWAAVGSGGKTGYIRTDSLMSFALKGSTVVRAEGEVLARAASDQPVLQLPVSTARRVSKMSAGEQVQVYAWTDAWAMIEATDGFMGFVPMSALNLIDDGDTPEATVAPEATPEAIAPVNGARYARVRRETPLFLSANRQSGVLSTLSEGKIVQISAASSAWAQVSIGNSTGGTTTGYVPMTCLETIQTDAYGNALVDGGDVTRLNGRKAMYVQFDNTPLYSSWSQGASTLETLSRGDYTEMIAYNNRWACVYAKGRKGYVLVGALGEQRPTSNRGIEGGTVIHAAEGTSAAARHAGVSVYQSWSTDSPKLAALEIGEKVAVKAYNSVWAMVQKDALTGYALMSDLAFVADNGATLAPTATPLPEEITSEDGVIQMEFDATAVREMPLYASVKDLNSVIATIPKGATVRVKAWKGSAAYVEYEGKYGYVRLKYLKKQ